MKIVYKQELNIYDPIELFLPKGSKFLQVHTQRNRPMVLYEFDVNIQETERRILKVYPTGQSFGDNHVYIGTFEVKSLAFKEQEKTAIESIKINEFIFIGHVYEEIHFK